MQISLTGFFEGKTQELILKLWKLLLSAQESVGGIPAEFLEAKKEQLRQQQVWKDYETHTWLKHLYLWLIAISCFSLRMRKTRSSKRMS